MCRFTVFMPLTKTLLWLSAALTDTIHQLTQVSVPWICHLYTRTQCDEKHFTKTDVSMCADGWCAYLCVERMGNVRLVLLQKHISHKEISSRRHSTVQTKHLTGIVHLHIEKKSTYSQLCTVNTHMNKLLKKWT